jgi:murein DD-endopeptidase MepM/ murein hydrolase activator NlpD
VVALVAAAALQAAAINIAVHARAVQPGELVVLTITLPVHRDQIHVRAFDREVAAYPIGPSTGAERASETWQALVGIDLDTKPAKYTVSVDAGGGAQAASTLVVLPKKFPTRRLTVDEDFVNPPASVRDRINRESKLLASTWNHPSAERLWSQPFARPVPQAANSRFGTRSIFNGTPLNAHGGADFLSPAGTPIHAPNAGRIVVARDLYFSGNTVVIDHGQGLFSLLAHLSQSDVHEGDRVEAGRLVGLVGATGRVTGPHLHWAVRANGARVDPLSVLSLLGAGDP